MRTGKPHDGSEPHRRDAFRTDDPLARLASPAPAGTVGGQSAGGASVETTDQPSDDADSGTTEHTRQYAWLALLPALATLAGLAVGAAFGFGVFDTATPGAQRAVAYAVLVPYFLLGVAGTLWLYEDATRLADADANWQPGPWRYVVGGGLALELYYLLPVLAGRGPDSGVVAYLAGGFVLALLLSSVVAGPVYLLQRRRHLDDAGLTPPSLA